MSENNAVVTMPQEYILQKIILLRNEKVTLDFHLAEIYGLEARALKQAVRKNADGRIKAFCQGEDWYKPEDS